MKKTKMSEQNRKLFIAVGILAILIIGGAVLGMFNKGAHNMESAEHNIPFAVTASAEFDCRDDKTISAKFGDSMVHLELSDGRTANLNQGISASGARYVNENETFVFWNKGDLAFIQENARITFVDCKSIQM